MAECIPPLNCGCAESNCPPFPDPDIGEPPSDGAGQPEQASTAEDCCECDDCGCESPGNGRHSTGVPSLDGSLIALRQVQRSAIAMIPSARGSSPGVNVASGNLYYNVRVVQTGAYAPPVRFSYNARAAHSAIKYGGGVAGLYNHPLV